MSFILTIPAIFWDGACRVAELMYTIIGFLLSNGPKRSLYWGKYLRANQNAERLHGSAHYDGK